MSGLGMGAEILLLLIVLMILQVPVGVALILTSIAGFYSMTGSIGPSTSLLLSTSLEVSSSPSLLVIPLFILMGGIAAQTGLVREIYDAANKLFGRLPGGLALATTIAAAGFATVTGSSISATAAMGKVALPEMVRHGYRRSFAAGCIAAAGTFAMIIPPSIVLVFYGIVAQESVGKLLVAGLVPGLLTVSLFSLLIMVRSILNPDLAPRPAISSWPETLRTSVRGAWFVAVLFVLILGILIGIWTATEAAAAGILVVVLIGALRRRLRTILALEPLTDAAMTAGTVLLIVLGSVLFGRMLAFSGVTDSITTWVIEMAPPPFLFFLALVALYIALGTFLEGISIIALTVPLVLPILPEMGWHPIWFGIVLVKMIEIGAITPPIGLNLFALQGVSRDLDLRTIVKGCTPFLLCELVILLILYAFPEIPLWLPNMM